MSKAHPTPLLVHPLLEDTTLPLLGGTTLPLLGGYPIMDPSPETVPLDPQTAGCLGIGDSARHIPVPAAHVAPQKNGCFKKGLGRTYVHTHLASHIRTSYVHQ